MTQKELRKLKKTELLEMMIALRNDSGTGGTGCVAGTAENGGTKRIASGGNRCSTGSSESITGGRR